jgi:CRISPR-associated protein Cmr3
MTATTCLALLPRDGLFCKDGRGWHTSASGRGHGLEWPWPSTILGAVRTAWGRREEQRSRTRFDANSWRTRTAGVELGRTLLLRRPLNHGATGGGAGGSAAWTPWTPDHRVWPVPSDAVWQQDGTNVHRLDPVRSNLTTLGSDDNEARESLWMPGPQATGKPLPAPRWWSEKHFTDWLAGRRVLASAPGHAFKASQRRQTHVGIDPMTLTASDGVLFSHDIVETLERDAEWAIAIEVTLPSGDLPRVATLGSDARLVQIDALPRPTFDPPASMLEAFRAGSPGLRLVVTSPACFERGWLPDGLEPQDHEYRGRLGSLDVDVVLRAAFVDRPLHVSGWNMARGAPKPTSRMVPPGAVYFFERVDRRPFAEAEARALWLAALGARTGEGFGRVVPGTWNPKRG